MLLYVQRIRINYAQRIKGNVMTMIQQTLNREIKTIKNRISNVDMYSNKIKIH